MSPNPNFRDECLWQVRPECEHPFLDVLRSAIDKYRLQSLRHYLLYIKVHQVVGKHVPIKQSRVIKLSVGFYNYGQHPILRDCGPEFATGRIVVMCGKSHVLLEDFLAMQFPINEEPLDFGYRDMLDWWSENGKTFNWTGLPIEIKEHIIRNCMTGTPYTPTDMISISYEGSSASARVLVSRFGTRAPRATRKELRGPYEITDKFNYSNSFLLTSHQVRCLALRMAFKGSSQFPHHEGLIINVVSGFKFTKRIVTLGTHYQELLQNGALMDAKTTILAEAYKYHPRIYPNLAQYATFAHGIQKVAMNLDYREFYGFFKVTVGNFEDYYQYPSYYANYETLQQLPNLRTVAIVLPDLWYYWCRHPRMQPPLYYDEFECPRTLARYLYERVAETLTFVPNVEIYNLVDEDEQTRFKMLRAAAIKKAMSEAELEELYKEDGGGIQLEEAVYHAPPPLVMRRMFPTSFTSIPGDNAFWPPKCRCPVRCYDVVHGENQ